MQLNAPSTLMWIFQELGIASTASLQSQLRTGTRVAQRNGPMLEDLVKDYASGRYSGYGAFAKAWVYTSHLHHYWNMSEPHRLLLI
jgi:hypothetical protein